MTTLYTTHLFRMVSYEIFYLQGKVSHVKIASGAILLTKINSRRVGIKRPERKIF